MILNTRRRPTTLSLFRADAGECDLRSRCTDTVERVPFLLALDLPTHVGRHRNNDIFRPGY